MSKPEVSLDALQLQALEAFESYKDSVHLCDGVALFSGDYGRGARVYPRLTRQRGCTTNTGNTVCQFPQLFLGNTEVKDVNHKATKFFAWPLPVRIPVFKRVVKLIIPFDVPRVGSTTQVPFDSKRVITQDQQKNRIAPRICITDNACMLLDASISVVEGKFEGTTLINLTTTADATPDTKVVTMESPDGASGGYWLQAPPSTTSSSSSSSSIPNTSSSSSSCGILASSTISAKQMYSRPREIVNPWFARCVGLHGLNLNKTIKELDLQYYGAGNKIYVHVPSPTDYHSRFPLLSTENEMILNVIQWLVCTFYGYFSQAEAIDLKQVSASSNVKQWHRGYSLKSFVTNPSYPFLVELTFEARTTTATTTKKKKKGRKPFKVTDMFVPLTRLQLLWSIMSSSGCVESYLSRHCSFGLTLTQPFSVSSRRQQQPLVGSVHVELTFATWFMEQIYFNPTEHYRSNMTTTLYQLNTNDRTTESSELSVNSLEGSLPFFEGATDEDEDEEEGEERKIVRSNRGSGYSKISTREASPSTVDIAGAAAVVSSCTSRPNKQYPLEPGTWKDDLS